MMGKAKFYLGEVGAGANMKLVVNAVMGTMMAAFAEGMSLADQVCLDMTHDVATVLCIPRSSVLFAVARAVRRRGLRFPAW